MSPKKKNAWVAFEMSRGLAVAYLYLISITIRDQHQAAAVMERR